MKQRIAIRKEDGNFLFGDGISDVLEVHNLSQLTNIDTFTTKHSGKIIFFILSYELGCLLLDTQLLASKKRLDLPLATFWVAEVTNESQYVQLPDWTYAFHSAPVHTPFQGKWQLSTPKEQYIHQIERVKEHIQRGDCYELNYCQHLSAQVDSSIDGLDVFKHILQITNAPHAVYVENDSLLIASGSPERFFKTTGNKLISQPIKGTAPRGSSENEDQVIIDALKNSEKDFVENVMIVDLVRNDCSKIATKGSVKVDELSQLHSFETVHQLISTISCELKPETTFSDMITALFPMGSMTGAPKKMAVQLSENYETTARNYYSGSVGYISPSGDIDCNVLIRSLFLDKTTNMMHCQVGGAITHLSNPEEEWEECKTKVGKIINRFGTCQW